MPSRAERLRLTLERLARAAAVAALAALLWRAVRPAADRITERAPAQLAAVLPAWTLVPPAEVHVDLGRVPAVETRDWLRALAATGTAVRWAMTRPLGAPAVVAEPVAGPGGAVRVRVAAGDSAGRVAVTDAAGPIDSVASASGAILELADAVGVLRAASATFAASTAPRDSVILRPVLVVGTAGWESKFVVAALEEAGWQVAARLRVAPRIEVTQPPLGVVDTARYSAVVALDSTAAPLARSIASFVQAGGGVVLAGAAARLPALSPIAPGAAADRLAGVAGATRGEAPRTGLSVFTLASLRAGAVALERRGDAVAVAARRVGAGRVVHAGYEDTWRWRMTGADDAAAAHRAWWSRLVSSVAYAPLAPLSPGMLDEAPVASLIAALGPPAAVGEVPPAGDGDRWTRWYFAILLASLLSEWGSRRLRGAP